MHGRGGGKAPHPGHSGLTCGVPLGGPELAAGTSRRLLPIWKVWRGGNGTSHSWGRGRAGGRGRGRSGSGVGAAPVQLAPLRQVLRAEEVAVKTSGGTAVSWLWGRLVLGTPGPPPAPLGSCAVQGPQLVSFCRGASSRGRQGMATLHGAEGTAPGQTSAGQVCLHRPGLGLQGTQLGLDVGTLHRTNPLEGPELGSRHTARPPRLLGPCPPGTPRGNPRLWSSGQGGGVPPA